MLAKAASMEKWQFFEYFELKYTVLLAHKTQSEGGNQ